MFTLARTSAFALLLILLSACAPRPAGGVETTTPPVLKHVVRPGDTLFRIGLYFGVSADALMAANGLRTTEIRVGQVLTYPWPKGARLYQRGLASWYGPGFHGRPTASGERFDQNALTAAHKRLPFGTRVLVYRVDSGETVVVRINDRGPFIPGRIIDLSKAAARAIGLDRSGVTEVKLYTLP